MPRRFSYSGATAASDALTLLSQILTTPAMTADSKPDDRPTPLTWWKPLHPPDGACLLGRMGHLELTLMRNGSEWLIHTDWAEERVDTPSWEDLPTPASRLEDAARFLFRDSADALELRPVLADRPVIAKPRTEVTIPGDNDTVVYIGTPLWVQLREQHDNDLLVEYPLERLSRTWFGRNAMDGDVCYSTQTWARLALENFPFLPDYAMTRVRIRNHTKRPLSFTHIRLPVVSLSIYRDADDRFVTEPITLEQKDDGLAAIEVDPLPRDSKHEQVGDRRQPLPSGSLMKALDRFF